MTGNVRFATLPLRSRRSSAYSKSRMAYLTVTAHKIVPKNAIGTPTMLNAYGYAAGGAKMT